MKRIVVCDSGLGGLNIAQRFFGAKANAEKCELLYFNAYPAPGRGFNDLASEYEQEEMLRNVLEGMRRFAPDLCLIACNTLSIVWERLGVRYRPPFPVEGIVEAAAKMMAEELRLSPDASLLILGTRSTVESGVYPERLAAAGVDQSRMRSLMCPGLATLLESGPDAPAVRERIAGYAREALEKFPVRPERLLLGLCCTHFGFAAPIWKREFERAFGIPVEVVDPNGASGTNFAAETFTYHARIGLFPGAREKMSEYFEPEAPEIASALRNAHPEPGLFDLDIPQKTEERP